MNESEIQAILQKQRRCFLDGKTLMIEKRMDMLQHLSAAIRIHENEIYDALKFDLGKDSFESYLSEVGLSLSGISWLTRHLHRLTREHRVRTPLIQHAARSYVKASPYGNVLIMSPWSSPFRMTIDPLADAIAAGNTAVIKMSTHAPATSRIVEQIVKEVFDPEYVTVITGSREKSPSLLDQKFDMIFFAGSKEAGHSVMVHTAAYGTPTVLIMGGKNPCIVDRSANLSLAARRIVWGKFLNCGQSCVAPDYILADEQIKDKLIEEIRTQIREQYGENPLSGSNYGKIVDQDQFDRICRLMERGKIVCGGKSDPFSLRIEPTVIDNVTWNDPVMQGEIFGPVLPVMVFRDIDDLPELFSELEKPLAFYLFSSSRRNIRMLTEQCGFGGGCVNDIALQAASSHLGFGGFAESGMGAIHGEEGFRSFSHYKSIVSKRRWPDLLMRYRPFSKFHATLVRLLLR